MQIRAIPDGCFALFAPPQSSNVGRVAHETEPGGLATTSAKDGETSVTKYACCYGAECPVCGDPPSYIEVDTKHFCATWAADHPERVASANGPRPEDRVEEVAT
jgi:hypothetical protein